MDKLAQDMSWARDELDSSWNEEREARLYVGVGRLRRRRAIQRTVGGTLAAVAVAVLALKVGMPDGQPAPQLAKAPVVAPVAAPALEAKPEQALAAVEPLADSTHRGSGHMLRMADGSTAKLIGEQSEVQILRNGESEVGVRLLAGRAEFDVVKNADREFVVEADDYRVVVVGTMFAVERSEQAVLVSVIEGVVRVEGPAGVRMLNGGESARFEPGVAEVQAPKRQRKLRARSQKPSWRSLSKNGEYDAAYEQLQQGTRVENDPAALMDAADAARLSGHPRGAVKYLERVLRNHAGSPVAPLAAFTLGRVYLDRLGQPHSAAKAFARARRLSPAGSLAQDALAREVEALSKAGNDSQANVRAQEYMRHYPQGRRLRAVQLYGGVK